MARRAPLLLLPLAAVAVAGVASAAAPTERFDGRTAGGAPVVLRMTGSRAGYDIGAGGRCSDGSRFDSGMVGHAAVAADGTFSADAPDVRARYRGRMGTYGFTLDARRTRDTVRGTVRVTFARQGLKCDSGRTAFTAHRDGTPGAELRDRRAATGRYTASGRGVRGVTVRVFLPTSTVQSVRLAWTVRCRRGVELTGRESFGAMTLRRGTFGASGGSRVSLGGGQVSRESYALAGRLFRARGVYRLDATWRLRSAIVRRGKVVNRCATDGLRFSGRLRGR